MKNESDEGTDFLKSESIETPGSLNSSSTTSAVITEETENADDEDASVENYDLHFSHLNSSDAHTSFSSGNA
ncbi:unnamed protein product [Ilex paraguariensis]|uniref:Uncharacterized protein n=1 Tax=Ilex paraguariensis TaxID=185542 RepID=A0ABC8V1J9_9AQUA